MAPWVHRRRVLYEAQIIGFGCPVPRQQIPCPHYQTSKIVHMGIPENIEPQKFHFAFFSHPTEERTRGCFMGLLVSFTPVVRNNKYSKEVISLKFIAFEKKVNDLTSF